MGTHNLSAVFQCSKISTKWADSVYEESSKAKRVEKQDGSSIGDKVDCRTYTKTTNGKIADLMNIEFAKNQDDKKFHDDHRKILREGKVIGDYFYASPFLNKRSKRSVAIHNIQIAATEGKIKKVKVVDNGLYAATNVGSLHLPSTQIEMRRARTLLERLFTLKRDANYLASCHTRIVNEAASAEKNMDKKQNNDRSPYEEEHEANKNEDHYRDWVRGSWFTPLPKKDVAYNGQYITGLFK